MIMRWQYALIGLVVSVVVGINITHFSSSKRPDLGIFNHIDISQYQDSGPDPMAERYYADFDESMLTYEHGALFNNKGMTQLLDLFRGLYAKNNMMQVRSAAEPKIPHIFHYIWLGRKLPEEYRPFLKTWVDAHPDWMFIFWVDNSQNHDLGQVIPGCTFEMLSEVLSDGSLPRGSFVVDVKNLAFDNRPFFDEASNYGEKSDILKWEAVYRFGGVYVDVDCECLQPLDPLNRRYDLYVGIQPLDTGLVQLGAAIFGAKPHHPILKHCVETIKDDREKLQIVVKTGPIHFTRSFFAMAGGHDTVDVALPAGYFYPCGYNQKGTDREVWIRPESFAVHHWAGSWLKPEGDVRNQALEY